MLCWLFRLLSIVCRSSLIFLNINIGYVICCPMSRSFSLIFLDIKLGHNIYFVPCLQLIPCRHLTMCIMLLTSSSFCQISVSISLTDVIVHLWFSASLSFVLQGAGPGQLLCLNGLCSWPLWRMCCAVCCLWLFTEGTWSDEPIFSSQYDDICLQCSVLSQKIIAYVIS